MENLNHITYVFICYNESILPLQKYKLGDPCKTRTLVSHAFRFKRLHKGPFNEITKTEAPFHSRYRMTNILLCLNSER